MLQDEAKSLVRSGVPLQHDSLEYKAIKLIADSDLSQEEISERLGEPLDAVKDAIETVEKEFLTM